jgi:hypothetical protein
VFSIIPIPIPIRNNPVCTFAMTYLLLSGIKTFFFCFSKEFAP